MLFCRFGGPKSSVISLCGELAITSHPHFAAPKERATRLQSLVPLFRDLLFRILHENGAHQAGESSCVRAQL
jgi:hypothetical protein